MGLNRMSLTDAERAAIGRLAWPRFGIDAVIHIAEAWNAGHGCQSIADKLGFPMRSVAMTIGKIKQAGVSLRTDRRNPAIQPHRTVAPDAGLRRF